MISLQTPQTRCRVAIARCDITPPVGIYHRMWGAAAHDRATGVHRPILATLLWLEPDAGDSSQALLIISLDHCDLTANRDLYEPERKQTVCGFNPHAPADDTVLVAKIIGANQLLVATIVNYGCHPTTLAWQNTLISPDYVGALRETVEQHTS